MSRLLVVSFEPGDAAQLSGFTQALGLPFDILAITGSLASDLGAERIFEARLPGVPPADGIANAIASKSNGYSHIAGLSNMCAKDVLARVAGILDAAMVTDVIGVDSPTVFTRPIVAGSIIATVEVLASPVVLTVRPAGFPKTSASGSSQIEQTALRLVDGSERVSMTSRGGSRPDLAIAKTVVSGGRPLKDAETFERVIGGLADALGGAVGATRAAVDSGIAANELQVGQTGKIVAPDLYIAAGISGSTQHMAGIKDSKVIVAINKDPDAAIFDFADLGLVADLFDAIPEFREKIGK
jgi:electron transfer flavoprotein alpha subunit